MSREQQSALLRQALELLPANQREVLVLSRHQDLKHDEIAQILGIEVGAAKVRLFHAVKALGAIYADLAKAS